MVQRRFRIMYHTEPPTDKTIREWYMKFHQSGCLFAAKRSGRSGPSAEIVERVREAFVRSPQKWPRVHISSSCKVGQKVGEILYPLICFFPPCLSWLLSSQHSKSRRDLWITLYRNISANNGSEKLWTATSGKLIKAVYASYIYDYIGCQSGRLEQCFSTAGPRPGTGPWHQLYRAARSSPGICSV